ncbi:hypothetical protein AGLY_016913 [Aphis glycines]|uniref:Uncharacterized protein n=1 Tax=Aphis glycines TaxID=307491 RepID=A0A6G0SYC8_APHGL|nr:hypothetical protein AGLY_016913 [Aphis glycines]
MEAAVIVNGFRESESMYGIRYLKLIADGDSSVYKQILEARPYKNRTVEKIECKNHLLRNFCKKMREIATKKQAGKLENRKLLQNNILRLRKGIISAIQYRRKNKDNDNDLRNDILNSIDHIFGQHNKCPSYFCNNENTINYLEKIKATDSLFYYNLMQPVRYLARHSRSLMHNVDSNVVESLNGIIAKLIGGKRVNFVMNRSYQGRVSAATVIKNTKRPLYLLHKALLKRSPGTKCLSMKLELKHPSYGENSQKPDMTEEQYEEEKNNVLQLLKEMSANRKIIERETIEQSGSKIWLEYRRNFITASNFGRIICLRSDTSCDSVVKSMLYKSDIDCKAMEYGREHEEEARLELEKVLDVQISKCDSKDYFLGATPDGLIGDDTLVELKCSLSAANITPEEGIF